MIPSRPPRSQTGRRKTSAQWTIWDPLVAGILGASNGEMMRTDTGATTVVGI